MQLIGNGEVLISHNEIYGNQTNTFEDETAAEASTPRPGL